MMRVMSSEKIQRLWEDTLKCEGLPEIRYLEDLNFEDLQNVIGLFSKQKICASAYIDNISLIVFGTGLWMQTTTPSANPTDSIHKFLSTTDRIKTFPLWFYAAFPDVMQWLDEQINEQIRICTDSATNQHPWHLLHFNKTMELLGINIDEVEDKLEVVNEYGRYRPSCLSNLVNTYIEKTGITLETRVVDHSDLDFYSGFAIDRGEYDNNIALVTDIVTQIYLELKLNFPHLAENEKVMFYIVSVIDLERYIIEELVSCQEIVDLIIFLDLVNQLDLKSLVVHLLMKIYTTHTDVDVQVLRDMVDENLDEIASTIGTVTSKFTGNPECFAKLKEFESSGKHVNYIELLTV